MKKEVSEVLMKRIAEFLKEKDTEASAVKALKKDLYFLLDDAFKNGSIPYRMVADITIGEKRLAVTFRPAQQETWDFELDGDYEVNDKPDQEEWPESVDTYPPVPLEKIREIENTAWDRFRAKLEPGYMIIQSEGESMEDALKRREDEVDKYLEEFDAEMSAQLSFEMKRGFPKNPWKEIDGCIVVRK